jgi:hypothetical protein
MLWALRATSWAVEASNAHARVVRVIGRRPISAKTPRGDGCWGDPGNGVQIGWFLWGEALARKAVGLSPLGT